jgi:hypothetical protein
MTASVAKEAALTWLGRRHTFGLLRDLAQFYEAGDPVAERVIAAAGLQSAATSVVVPGWSCLGLVG